MKRLLGIFIIVFIISIPLDIILIIAPEIWYVVPISYIASAALFGFAALASYLLTDNSRRFR